MRCLLLPVPVPGSHPPHGMFALEVGLGKRLPLEPFRSSPKSSSPCARAFPALLCSVAVGRQAGWSPTCPGEQPRKSSEKTHWMKGAWLQDSAQDRPQGTVS